LAAAAVVDPSTEGDVGVLIGDVVGDAAVQWFYEKSGAIFVTAKIGHGVCDGERCYTLMVSTKIYQVLRGGASDGEPWRDMYGYELDREKFLGSLRLGSGKLKSSNATEG